MDLAQLKYFKVVAECNNMSEAAEKLHISQPALSSAVKRLESELGVLLFDRTKNKIILNDAGKLALAHAKAVLAKVGEMKNTFMRFSCESGLLTLGFCDPGPMRFSVPQLQKAYPNLNISSELLDNENNLEALLLSHKYDALVSLRKPNHEDIVTVPFASEELMLSLPAGHSLAEAKSVSLLSLPPMEMLHFTADGAYVRRLQPFIDKLKSRHAVKIFQDYFLFRQVLNNQNAACLTTRLVRNYRNDGDNRIAVSLEDKGIKATYLLSYLKKNSSHLAPQLEWLKRFSMNEHNK